MKRLLTRLVGTFTAVALLVTPISTDAYVRWKVNIYDPAASTTTRTLNVRYQVLSTEAADNSYAIKLLQNGTQVSSTQNIARAYGDSGVFNISIPSTGTYTYQVVATNNNAGETKSSDVKTVNIVDGPAPTVTTMTVAQPAAAPAGGAGGAGGAGAAGGAGGGAVAGAPGAAGQAGPGAVAAAGDQNPGTVTDEAANTGANNNQDVLGTQASANRARQNRNRNWLAAGAVLLAAGAGYVFYRRRAIANE